MNQYKIRLKMKENVLLLSVLFIAQQNLVKKMIKEYCPVVLCCYCPIHSRVEKANELHDKKEIFHWHYCLKCSEVKECAKAVVY